MFDGGDVVEVPEGVTMYTCHCIRGCSGAACTAPGSCACCRWAGETHRQPHVIYTPMKGIPTLRRKCGNTTNFRAITLYHQTAQQANSGTSKSQYLLPLKGPLIGTPGAPCIVCSGIPGMLCIGTGARFVAQYGQNAQRSSRRRSHLGQGRLSF